MINTPLKKSVRTRTNLFVYLFLIILSFGLIYFVGFPFILKDFYKINILISFSVGFIFSVIAWLKDPGYLKRDTFLPFLELLE